MNIQFLRNGIVIYFSVRLIFYKKKLQMDTCVLLLGTMVYQIMAPKDIKVLIPNVWKYYLTWQMGSYQYD